MPLDRRIVHIPICEIVPNPYQPRQNFDPDGIASLAESIRLYGLLAPLLVRRKGAGCYELIAGERRLRALQLLARSHAEAIVLSAYDRDCALISLIENLERQQLHFLDEAEACRRILDEHGLTQELLASTLNRSPSALANLLRLLRLDEATRACIRENALSERHARALLRLESAMDQLSLARQSAENKWSVRQLEAQVERLLFPPAVRPQAPRIRDGRLILNAFRDTLRQLQRIGVRASSRIEDREDSYDLIVTIQKSAQS